MVVSSAVETTVGIAAGLALAAALPELPYACGLNTGPLLATDVADAYPVVEGAIALRPVTVDPDRLAAIEAPPAVQRAWRARLDATRAATQVVNR